MESLTSKWFLCTLAANSTLHGIFELIFASFAAQKIEPIERDQYITVAPCLLCADQKMNEPQAAKGRDGVAASPPSSLISPSANTNKPASETATIVPSPTPHIRVCNSTHLIFMYPFFLTINPYFEDINLIMGHTIPYWDIL